MSEGNVKLYTFVYFPLLITCVIYKCLLSLQCSNENRVNRSTDLKGREAFLQELEFLFQKKEEMLNDEFFSEYGFGDAVLDTIFDFFEQQEESE